MKFVKQYFMDILFCVLFVAGVISILIVMVDFCENKCYEDQIQVQYIDVIRYATEQEQIEHDIEELEMIAKTVYGEASGCSLTEQAAVVWCILNRVDDDRFPDNITDVITQKNQFSGYNENHPVKPEILELAKDVMTRWVFEKTAAGDVGRILPEEYCWFRGNGVENIFRDAYKEPYTIWDWSLESPYEG